MATMKFFNASTLSDLITESMLRVLFKVLWQCGTRVLSRPFHEILSKAWILKHPESLMEMAKNSIRRVDGLQLKNTMWRI